MHTFKNIFRLYLALILLAPLTGCKASLPFHYGVVPVIPENMRIKGAYAKAYAVNDSGHVVGIYSPPAPRKSDQIFVLADGHLTMMDYPCDGPLYANIITNTGLIAGHCQSTNGDRKIHSFVFSYAQPSAWQAIQPDWPTKGYLVSGLNDRGDAIGFAQDIFGTADLLGFIYVSGKLHMVRKADLRSMNIFSNSVLSQSGLVLGGERSRSPIQVSYPYMFVEDKFVEIPSDVLGRVKGINSKGHFVLYHQGRTFGVWDGKYRTIDCGKEWCSAEGMNDQGWVIGNRHTTYPVPPMGASIGHTFLWMNERFYNLDDSVRLKINSEYPVKLSNEGHLLFHSDGWPYLLTPESLPRQAAQIQPIAATPSGAD
jgi:hypothetical protein